MNKEQFFKAHTNALLRDYKNFNADLIEQQSRRAYWREVFAGFVFTAFGLFVGFVLVSQF